MSNVIPFPALETGISPCCQELAVLEYTDDYERDYDMFRCIKCNDTVRRYELEPEPPSVA